MTGCAKMLLSAALVMAASARVGLGEIKHRLLIVDESRHALRYVDESDAMKNWDMPIGGGFHDIQLIGGNRAIVSSSWGYSVYDLAARKLLREVKPEGITRVYSARRTADGTVLLGTNQKQGVVIFELDKDGAVIRKATFPKIAALRAMRLTRDGHIMLAENDGATEVAFDASAGGGKIIRRVKLPRSRNAFMALKKPGGNYLVSGGFASTFYEFKPDGSVVSQWQAKTPAGLVNGFYAGFSVLNNGHVVVANWTGHGATDSKKGWQIIEFDRSGKVVWKWHDPDRAGSLNNVIVADDLDFAEFQDDADLARGAGGKAGTAGSGKAR